MAYSLFRKQYFTLLTDKKLQNLNNPCICCPRNKSFFSCLGILSASWLVGGMLQHDIIVKRLQTYYLTFFIVLSVGGTVLAGGAAAFGAGVLTNNQGLRDAGLTSVLAGGALKGVSTLLGKK